ncbi:MAG: helix-turn-helix domain-containing protein [Bacteroides sp.]|nr:helix-turn-helix domain-containing protein [Bacteroides sp.]
MNEEKRIAVLREAVEAVEAIGAILARLEACLKPELTVNEAAAYMGMSVGKVRDLISRGLLTAHRPEGTRRKYVSRSEIERYMARQERIYTLTHKKREKNGNDD